MNPMFDFSAKEISMIQMSVSAIAQTTQHAISEGATPPDGFMETIESVIHKLNLVVEARIENDNQFESIVEAKLQDVEEALMIISQDPTIETEQIIYE